jgi:hypothetical protein
LKMRADNAMPIQLSRSVSTIVQTIITRMKVQKSNAGIKSTNEIHRYLSSIPATLLFHHIIATYKDKTNAKAIDGRKKVKLK